MIFVHGGSYDSGSGNLLVYAGHTLAGLYDMVIVTINYRLSILGFLTSGDSVLPGNLGLWDQHLAFQWVKENIADYGGNASSVTIFGESAGASAVMYHMLSPKNDRSIFQRVIAQSPNAPYLPVVERNPMATTASLVSSLNCTVDAGLVTCLRSKTVQDLMNAAIGQEFYPIADDDFLVKGVGNIYANFYSNQNSSDITSAIGNFLDYDLFGGWNDQEGLLFMNGLSMLNVKMTNQTDLESGVNESVLLKALQLFYISPEIPAPQYQFARRFIDDYYLQNVERSANRSEEKQRLVIYEKLAGK